MTALSLRYEARKSFVAVQNPRFSFTTYTHQPHGFLRPPPIMAKSKHVANLAPAFYAQRRKASFPPSPSRLERKRPRMGMSDPQSKITPFQPQEQVLERALSPIQAGQQESSHDQNLMLISNDQMLSRNRNSGEAITTLGDLVVERDRTEQQIVDMQGVHRHLRLSILKLQNQLNSSKESLESPMANDQAENAQNDLEILIKEQFQMLARVDNIIQELQNKKGAIKNRIKFERQLRRNRPQQNTQTHKAKFQVLQSTSGQGPSLSSINENHQQGLTSADGNHNPNQESNGNPTIPLYQVQALIWILF